MEDNKRISEAFENGTLHQCKVDELKNYLRSVCQPVSGKKNELVERVAGALRLRLQNVNTVVHDDRVEFERPEKERLLTPVGEELTHPSYIDKWISDVTMISRSK